MRKFESKANRAISKTANKRAIPEAAKHATSQASLAPSAAPEDFLPAPAAPAPGAAESAWLQLAAALPGVDAQAVLCFILDGDSRCVL